MFSRHDKPEEEGKIARKGLPSTTTHDAGALHVLRLLKHDSGLTQATKALPSLVRAPLQSNAAQVLQALQNARAQAQDTAKSIGSVQCDTHNGRHGQQLALHSLRLTEQAFDHIVLALLHPGDHMAQNLLDAKKLAQDAQRAARHGLRMLIK